MPRSTFSSKIFDIVGHHIPQINCYTDDSKLHLSFNPSYAFSQDEAIRSMETCISDVKQWMTSDKLMLHDDKTEFIVTASRHLLKKAAVNTIRVGDCDVSKVSVVRNLGAWFDDQLTMAVNTLAKCGVLLSISCTTLETHQEIPFNRCSYDSYPLFC